MRALATRVRPGNSPQRRAGFTLVEMVLSMMILMVILTGTYSVVRLASKVAPDRNGPQTCMLDGARVLDQLTGDLTYATAVVDIQATSITFKVSDRTGDGIDETVKYSWSGLAGGSLNYSLNGAAEVAIADDVREFDLTLRTGSRTPPPVYQWSNETLLISHDFLVNLGSGSVTSSAWFGEYFMPTFSSDVRNWKITRARVQLKSNGAIAGQTLVQIRSASGGLPTSTILDQATIDEGTLGALLFAWQGVTFAGCPAIAPSKGACLVLATTSGSAVADVQFQNLLYAGGHGFIVKTTNGGSAWTSPTDQSLLYEIYGQVESKQAAAAEAYVDQVKCGLRLGASGLARVESLVRVLNQPDVP